jgi:hypothetical protein
MKLQEKNDVVEDSCEFGDEDKTLRVWSDYPLEKKALQVYTRPIYLHFKAELRKVTSYNVHLGEQVFDVMPIKDSVFGYGNRTYSVIANLEAATYNCECCKFSRDGLLCCHVMRVMVQIGAIDSIPPHYILRRWRILDDTIVVQKQELPEVPTDRKMNNKKRQLMHYGTLCNDYTKIAKIASASKKGKLLVEKYMAALENDLKSMKVAEVAKRKKKNFFDTPQGDVPDPETGGDDGQGISSCYDNIGDPTITTTNGHPGEKRKQSDLHLKSTKAVKCTLCCSTVHNTATCSTKIIPGQEPWRLISSATWCRRKKYIMCCTTSVWSIML